MIKCTNTTKKYGNTSVLKGIDLDFPNNGLIAICGDSGSGKTTLLNILSGLLEPDCGTIYFKKKPIYSISDKKRSDLRLKSFGFVFQDYKLFEYDTVKNNICMPMEALTYIDDKNKSSYCRDLLDVVGLNGYMDKTVSTLSGGEKQRVAIARALVNDPDVIFADEPTGALDSSSSKMVIEILKMISKKSLVIMVSHDIPLVKKYADKIYYLKDGQISNHEELFNPSYDEKLLIRKIKRNNHKPSLPNKFLFHHTINKIKSKKWRNIVCHFAISLSLVGVGMSLSIVTTVGENIKNAYSEMFGGDRVLVSQKANSYTYDGLYAADLESVNRVIDVYRDDINDYGVIYANSFSFLFVNSDCFYITGQTGRLYFDNIGANIINEYKWLDNYKDVTFYPERVEQLDNNEICLGLTFPMIQEICKSLQIERTINSLSDYLSLHPLVINYECENISWQYHRNIVFYISAFSLEKSPCIYHSSSLFNEEIFENKLSLPPSNFISGINKYPWMIKKIYYLDLKEGPEIILTKLFYDDDFDSLLFEIGNKMFMPNLYKESELIEQKRLLIFEDSRFSISRNMSRIIERHMPELFNPIYASSDGYSFYASSLLSGFSHETFFGTNDYELDDLIDSLTSLNSDGNISSLPKGILNGHYSASIDNGVMFQADNSDYFKTLPLNNVAISSHMAMSLFNRTDVVGETLKMRTIIDNDYQSNELKIIKVIESKKNIIYHRSDWSILFFQCEMGISSLLLGVQSIAFELNTLVKLDDYIVRANKYFKDYYFYNPVKDFSDSVNQTCSYMQIGLLAFSFISILISLILLSSCVKLHILDTTRDISLSRCLGLPKKESMKFVIFYSLILSGSAFLSSVFQLLIFNLVSSLSIQLFLRSSFLFSFDFRSLLFMFVFTILISLVSSLCQSKKIMRLSPIQMNK